MTILPVDYRRVREVLRQRRFELSLKVQELAELAGVERTTIYRLENLKRLPDFKPDFDTIEKLSTAMQLTLGTLFARVEGIVPSPVPSAAPPPQSDDLEHVRRLLVALIQRQTTSVIRTEALRLCLEMAGVSPDRFEKVLADVREHYLAQLQSSAVAEASTLAELRQLVESTESQIH